MCDVLSNYIFTDNRKSSMGCNESHQKKEGQRMHEGGREFTEIRPIQPEQNSYEVIQEVNKNPKTPKKTVVPVTDASMILKENQQNSLEDNEENSKIKVKKARHYRIRPEHQRFIENILESNRAKAVTEFPPTSAHPNPSSLKKSVVSLHSKSQEPQTNKQNAQILKEAEQKIAKNASTEPKYTRKQAQKIFNNILQGKMNQFDLNHIGERMDLEQLDSNKTLQL